MEGREPLRIPPVNMRVNKNMEYGCFSRPNADPHRFVTRMAKPVVSKHKGYLIHRAQLD